MSDEAQKHMAEQKLVAQDGNGDTNQDGAALTETDLESVAGGVVPPNPILIFYPGNSTV